MHTHPAIDLGRLLAPVAADRPAGESLRYGPVYDAVSELRREDDPTLPQGVWKRELKRADWHQVAAVAAEALAGRSKDLQLAAWLMEAWIHLYDLPGAEQGLLLLAGLCRSFWDDLHPRPQDGDPEFRLAPLRWVDDHLSQALKEVEVTRPVGEEAAAYRWCDWEGALYLARLAGTDRDAAREAEAAGAVTQPQVLASLAQTPGAYFLQLSGEVEGARAALGELEAVLAGRVGPGAVSFRALAEVLEAMAVFVDRVLAERVERGELVVEAGANGPSPVARAWTAPREPLSGAGPIGSRAEAYRLLDEAADYLMRTEPHSPAPYLVKRAVLWGNLSLAELLSELLADRGDLATIYKLLGIQRGDAP